MKTTTFALGAAALLLATAGQAQIVVDGVVDAGYGPALATDPVVPEAGEGGPDATSILDLSTLHVTDDGTSLYIAVSIAGDIVATDWGKYIITINSPGIAGTATNIVWGRGVTVDSNYQILTWVDFGTGTEFFKWDGAAWQASAAGAAFVGNTSVPGVVEASVTLAELGNPASVDIVAFSTGGGTTDPGMDILPTENGNSADWGVPTTITTYATYTISASSVDDWMVLD